MIQIHRSKINANIDKLIDGTNLGFLLPKLVEKGVFLENMATQFKTLEKGKERDFIRDMYLHIQTRGPDAFTNLMSALKDSGHYSLVALLDSETASKTKVSTRHSTQPFIRPAYETEGTPIESFKKYDENELQIEKKFIAGAKKIQVKKSTHAIESSPLYKTEIYSMTSNPKGYAVIINITKYDHIVKNDLDADTDEVLLKYLFEELGYAVFLCKNLTKDDLIKKLRAFAKDKAHSQVDSCVVAILCHGEQHGDESYLMAADGKEVRVNEVLQLFSNENSPSLRKKPKLFLFQCCRGDRSRHGIKDSTRTETDGDSNIPLRTYSDMLIAFSTVNGKKSPKGVQEVPSFIQAICDIFKDHAHDTEIMEMLKLVDCELEKTVTEEDINQVTYFENRGFKTFFFNPGVFDQANIF